MIDLLQIVFGLAVIVAFVWASVRIFQKAGYSGWLAVLYLIPVVNVLTFFWFATAEWPVAEELRLRAGAPKPGPSAATSEEEAWELYHEAIGLEIAGRADEALLMFQEITGPETPNHDFIPQNSRRKIPSLFLSPSPGNASERE